jgi:hypothetical protein
VPAKGMHGCIQEGLAHRPMMQVSGFEGVETKRGAIGEQSAMERFDGRPEIQFLGFSDNSG